MQKPVVWATIAISALFAGSAAYAQEKPAFNDYRSQFEAQKAAIAEQSAGQWIHGKREAPQEEEGLEGNYNAGERVSGDPVQVHQPDYESNPPKIGYHTSGSTPLDRVGAGE